MTLYKIIRCAEIDKHTSFNSLTDAQDSIQVSARKLSKDFEVKAHKHLPIERHTNCTQEAWIVIRGQIKADIYDTNDKLFETVWIYPGDCIVFLAGGHSLTVIQEDTIMYEIKTGPYYGTKVDKQYI